MILSHINRINRTLLKKILLGMILGAIIITSCWMAGLYWLSQEIHKKRHEIQALIEQKVGYPVTFDSIETHTKIEGIYLSLTNVIVKDPKILKPFMAIKQLELHPNLVATLFKRTLVLKEIQLDGLKMRYGWDTQQKYFKLLSLEGEEITSETDYKSVLAALASQQGLILQDADIVWEGQSFRIVQRLTGEFSWVSTTAKSFQFKGNQALKINEGAFFKRTPLEFMVDPNAEKGYLKTGLANAAVDCTFSRENGFVCDLKTDQLDLASLHHNMILKEGPEGLTWLLQALPRGTAAGTVKISGNSESIDWKGELRYRKVYFKYAEKWPAIENAAGLVKIEKNIIKVEVNQGDISGVPLKKVTASIAPLATLAAPIVEVTGYLEGDLENGMEFLKESPLVKVYKPLAEINPKGGMDLNISLKIPLNEAPTEVKGSVKVKQGHLMLSEFNLPVEQVNGTFYFTEKGVSTQEPVQALFLQRPLKIQATPEKITAETFLTTAFIQQQFNTPFLNSLQGGSDVVLDLATDDLTWTLQSDLKGVAIDLPEPLNKEKEDILPLTVVVRKTAANETQFSLHADKVIDAKWTVITQKRKTTLKNGHFVIGEGLAEGSNQNTLLIGGKIADLNINQWREFIEQQTETISGVKIPVRINLLTNRVQAFGTELTKTRIIFDSRQPYTWMLEGPLLKGIIIVPSMQKNSLQFDLDYLNISTQENEKQNLINKFLNEGSKTPIVFSTRNLNFGSTPFGQVSFYLDPIKLGYAIREFTVKSDVFLLEATGTWKITEQNNGTSLQGQLFSNNMGMAFNRIGFSSLAGGNGRIEFDFQWNDTPLEFALKKVQGVASLQMKSGTVQGVNPGLGKIFGLLSLDNIRRRLQFDFNDVAHNGFGFDTLKAALKFQRGIATVENFNLEGPAAGVTMTGRLNLANKGLDLNMKVTPKAVSSNLPLAAGLATGNPAIGLGVWVIDKFTGSKINALTQFNYHVTGTWDAPNMNEVGRKGNR